MYTILANSSRCGLLLHSLCFDENFKHIMLNCLSIVSDLKFMVAFLGFIQSIQVLLESIFFGYCLFSICSSFKSRISVYILGPTGKLKTQRTFELILDIIILFFAGFCFKYNYSSRRYWWNQKVLSRQRNQFHFV